MAAGPQHIKNNAIIDTCTAFNGVKYTAAFHALAPNCMHLTLLQIKEKLLKMSACSMLSPCCFLLAALLVPLPLVWPQQQRQPLPFCQKPAMGHVFEQCRYIKAAPIAPVGCIPFTWQDMQLLVFCVTATHLTPSSPRPPKNVRTVNYTLSTSYNTHIGGHHCNHAK